MKKLLIAIAAAAVLLTTSSKVAAQGTVDFGNSTQLINTNGTSIGEGMGKIATGKYVFGIYFGSTMAALTASTTPVLTVTNSGFPGFVTTATFTLSGFNTGDTFFFQIKGWQVGTGNTYETTTGKYGGVSGIGQVTLGGGTVAAGKIFFVNAGTTPNGVTAFELVPIPEPTTLAIGGLGLASMLFLRRKKN